MKKITTLFIFMISLLAFNAKADSEIYVFAKSLGNFDAEMSINGKSICDLNGSEKKRSTAPGFKEELVMAQDCYRKIIVPTIGEYVITINGEYVNPANGETKNYTSEYTINLEDGKKYYLSYKYKGLSDMQIVEAKEKDAQKWIEKWEELPAVTFNNK